LYGGIPPSPKRATELESGELNHWIDLGFADAAVGRMAEARSAREHGLAMPDRGKHDPMAKRRAREAVGNL